MISHKYKCLLTFQKLQEHLERFLRSVDLNIPQKVLRKRGFSHFLNKHLDYYVFSFVRDPYDHLVSAWKWGQLKFKKEGDLPFYKKDRVVSVRRVCAIKY